ncbi:MAG: signal peptidase I [Muribaculaceae bacterium]|nr:signal peptidase I [Muribaculaceae bacterium]
MNNKEITTHKHNGDEEKKSLLSKLSAIFKSKKKDKEQNTEPKEKELPQPKHGNLVERLKQVKTTRWVRFGIVSVLFFALVAWIGNWWLALIWFLLADIYLTQFIPWNWWKYSKNKTTRVVMGWVDAIAYALVFVYLIFTFIGQNYQIPSSSLEKSLLTGDYLWVNKFIYGPRIPQTPLHFPLAQNTMPLVGGKSYIEKPQLPYNRLAGLRNVERFDIVVFNYPAGDTVVTKVNNPDYYNLCKKYGKETLLNNEQEFGKLMWRPVDRRDAYVKRTIGLPGERIKIIDGLIYINGKPLREPENMQFNYIIQTNGTEISEEIFDELEISEEAQTMAPVQHDMNGNLYYILPLTKQMKQELQSNSWVTNIERLPDNDDDAEYTYPLWRNYGWTHNNYATDVNKQGLWIPKKGVTLELTEYNLPLYERCIKNYEGNDLEVKDGKIFINGQPATSYTFKMDYYWMMGDNRDNSSDSRYWGFVPEDHIIGAPMFVIVSFDKDKPFFGGKIRWNRILKNANPDK